MFGRKKHQAAASNPMHITHQLILEGRCPTCRQTVTTTGTYTAVLGETGTASGFAICCGGEVDVSTRF